ncbi:MAG: COX15/CtaA family protein, partial [Gemmatimonadaceae bacterium]
MDHTTARPLVLARWLMTVACLVFVMVVVGGITRLTESGLSITKWQLVTGVIPPLTAADWNKAFALYQATSEYRLVNGPAGMDLAAFKVIFFWEWLHRLLGRVVGLAFALPLAWYAVKRAIPRGYGWRLVALLLLGASQGALGWYMVQSGLANRTDVSHFRLSAHLLTALFILAGLVWTALDLRQLAKSGADRPARL